MTFLSRPVFNWYPDFSKGVGHGQLDDFSYESSGGGLAVPWKVTDGPKRTLSLPFTLNGQAEIFEMRAFVAERDGRRQGFWLPVWLTDFVPTQDRAATLDTITIKSVNLESKSALSAQFDRLAVITKEKLEIYEIESVTELAGVETITLDRGLDTALVARKTVICGVLYARLADDEVKYNYATSALVNLDLKFVELPKEASGDAHDGTQPVFLYRFTRGATVWRFTGWGAPLTIDGDTWAIGDIEHGELFADTEFASDPVSMTVVTDDPEHPLRALLVSALVQITDLEIFEADFATLTPDFDAPIYTGRLDEVTFREKGVIDVKLSSLLRIGEQEVPTVQLQRLCNHRLYDAGCGLVEATFTTAGTITAMGNVYIEAPEFATKATAESDPNWFALGKVIVGEEIRFCTGQDGARLYLNAKFRSAIVGDAVTAASGCDKKITTCEGKFDNLVHNLSFPFIPSQNPQFVALTNPQTTGGKK